MISCRTCTCHFYVECFTYIIIPYNVSLMLSLNCQNCMKKIWRNVGLFINQKNDGFDDILVRLNENLDKLDIILNPVSNSTFNQIEIGCANRGFENKQSNCWAFCLIQLMYSCNIKDILTTSESL